jgi:hypothetical protein
MRRKESHENIEFYHIFSKFEGTVTGETVNNKQSPHMIRLLLELRAGRHIMHNKAVIFILKVLVTPKPLLKA